MDETMNSDTKRMAIISFKSFMNPSPGGEEIMEDDYLSTLTILIESRHFSPPDD